MRKILIAVALLSLSLAGCGSASSPETTATTPTATPSPTWERGPDGKILGAPDPAIAAAEEVARQNAALPDPTEVPLPDSIAPADPAPAEPAPANHEAEGQAWLSGARAAVGGSDIALAALGATLCSMYPMTAENATMFADQAPELFSDPMEVMTLTQLAVNTICPNGVLYDQ